MRERIAAFFEFHRYQTIYRREFVAGITTFVTMSYLVAVNPAILKAAGIPEGASMTATIVTAIVGSMMMAPIAKIDFDDPTESLPAFATIALISFTYNIGVGITAGLVPYPMCKVIAARGREVPAGLWVLALLSMMFFRFYPYR